MLAADFRIVCKDVLVAFHVDMAQAPHAASSWGARLTMSCTKMEFSLSLRTRRTGPERLSDGATMTGW